MARTAKTFCRNCGALCSLKLTIEDDRITRLEPDGSVTPYGAYACPKGLSSMDFHNGDDGRLLASLKRAGDGSLASIDTAQAVDEIGDRLADLVAAHGPRAVAVYHGTGAYRSTLGNFMEKAFLAALGTPNLFSTMTIDQSAKWVTSGRMGMMASSKPSIRDVDLVLLAGNNPVVSHQTWPFVAGESGAPGRAYDDAKARGCRFIIVDPRRTETARFADLLIQPLPGHDAALFAAIAHILLRDGTYDHAFCDRFVIQTDELRAATAPFTPEFAALSAHVPVEQIELAARWIGEAQRPCIGSGSGPSFSAHSNLSDHMIEAVNALVGGYRRAGDRVRNPGTLKPKPVMEMAVSPTRSWEHGPKCHSTDIGALFGEFPSALLPQEILTPGTGKIRALIVFGGNPLVALGDPARALPAFADLDLLVSLDCRLNETGRVSHYVIASSQPYERHDLSTTADAQYPEPFAQYAPPALPLPPGLVHDWAFFWRIAARMGLKLVFKYWGYGLRHEDIARGLELDMANEPDPEALVRFLCEEGRVRFEDLVASPAGVRPDVPAEFVQSVPDRGGRLHLCPSDVAVELATVFRENTVTEYPYRLTSRRILEAMNSAYVDSRRTRRKYPVNYAYMNPQDMESEGLTEGARIEIRSENGVIQGVLKSEARLRRGVVSMTHMFGLLRSAADATDEGGSNVGQLTSLQRHLQPINFMPRFSGIPIAIRPRSAAQAG